MLKFKNLKPIDNLEEILDSPEQLDVPPKTKEVLENARQEEDSNEREDHLIDEVQNHDITDAVTDAIQ